MKTYHVPEGTPMDVWFHDRSTGRLTMAWGVPPRSAKSVTYTEEDRLIAVDADARGIMRFRLPRSPKHHYEYVEFPQNAVEVRDVDVMVRPDAQTDWQPL